MVVKYNPVADQLEVWSKKKVRDGLFGKKTVRYVSQYLPNSGKPKAQRAAVPNALSIGVPTRSRVVAYGGPRTAGKASGALTIGTGGGSSALSIEPVNPIGLPV